MTTLTLIQCLIAGLLGVAFHIFAIKVPSTKQRATAANIAFSYKAFFSDELAAIISSVLALFIYLFVLQEIITYKPDVQPYVIALSVFIGFTGSSVLIAVLGKASGKINAIVDIKTNVADGIDTPAPPAG